MIPHAFPANETNNINEHKVLIMSPIFTVIIIILALLAILDLIVGVANDAVNFLNSALGAKVANSSANLKLLTFQLSNT